MRAGTSEERETLIIFPVLDREITVEDDPAPIKLMDLVTFKVEVHVQVPAGMATVSPADAAL